MWVEIVCSSREVFGSDRSAVRLGRVLRDLGVDVRLVVPERRPERGLLQIAESARLDVEARRLPVATSRGVDDPAAVLVRRPARADLTIFNSSAVVRAPGAAQRRILVLREWLEPSSRRHQALARWHARRIDAVVGISRGVIDQWCAAQNRKTDFHVIPNWLGQELESIRQIKDARSIVCIGRFNAWKGQEVLADAYLSAFGQDTNRPPLVFVGAEEQGSTFRARADAVRAKTTGAWKFIDRTDDPWAAVGDAALVVIPSMRPEPFGNVALEGIARGCRVLAFPGGGPTDLSAAFPGVVRLVNRSVSALAAALSEWDSGGRAAQTTSEYAASSATLRRLYSTEAARERWSRVLRTFS
jgi:glycosyltransferase involved in cell wall biosynthesis